MLERSLNRTNTGEFESGLCPSGLRGELPRCPVVMYSQLSGSPESPEGGSGPFPAGVTPPMKRKLALCSPTGVALVIRKHLRTSRRPSRKWAEQEPTWPRRVSPASLSIRWAVRSQGGPDPGSWFLLLGLKLTLERAGVITVTARGYPKIMSIGGAGHAGCLARARARPRRGCPCDLTGYLIS